MVWYLAIAVVCAGLVPWARKRSEGSMTRYSVGTGAPVVIVVFGLAALLAAVAQGQGDSDLAREVFTGGLIGGALAQFVLLRRTYGLSLGQHPAKAVDDARAAEEAQASAEAEGTPSADPDTEPDERRATRA